MNHLVRNESIKIYRQTGYRVLIIIILALALLIPTGSFVINKITESIDSSVSAEGRYDSLIEWAEGMEKEDEPGMKATGAVYRAQADALRFFIDNDLDTSWKYNLYYQPYSSKREAYALIGMLADGKVTYAELQNTGNDWKVQEYMNARDEELVPTERYYYTDGVYYEEYPDASAEPLPNLGTYTRAQWQQEYAELGKKLEGYEKQILDASPKLILKSKLDSASQQVLEAEENLATAEANVKLAQAEYDKKSDENTLYLLRLAEYNRDCAAATRDSAKEVEWAYRFLYENECSPDSWQYNAVNSSYAGLVLGYYNGIVIMPKEVWEHDGSGWYDSYEEYQKDFEKNGQAREAAHDGMKMIRYALENDCPLSVFRGEKSVKDTLKSSLTSIMSMVTIFAIVMAGMMIASEHTEGTIRLLLIRPKKRHKIMTSKILTMLLYTVGLTLAAGLILSVMTVIFNGFGDLLTPDLMIMGGEVVAVPFIVTALIVCLCSLATALLMASIALFFSTVTKRSVLSIAFPLIIMSMFAVVQLLSLTFMQYLPILKFTILPYVSLSMFLTSPLADSYTYQMTLATLGLPYGLIMILLHTAVFVVFTYVAFNRQQIKN